MRTGTAQLPLHRGRAPAWLFGRMARLAAEISTAIVFERGADDLLDRLSDPFWFQAFGCALGFDWHSSGLTTTVCGALKEGLRDRARELGVVVCGGKGAASRRTPVEIAAAGDAGLAGGAPARLVYASRMSAKVDSAALQDGYALYHHCFILTRGGNWAVVQQGMNAETRWARRYHWLGREVGDFVCEPHAAVCGGRRGPALNMVAAESGPCRRASAALAAGEPGRVVEEFARARRLALASRHSVSLGDIRPENLKRVLEKTYEARPPGFEELLGTAGVGAKTVRALAMVAELVYGAPASLEDPVRFSFAHGGKDGHPYPVDRAGYDRSIRILEEAVNRARVGRTEKLAALKRLGARFAPARA